MFTIDMLPASLGDSLWVEYGRADRPNRFLIDGGLVGTAERIEQRIRQVAANEGGRCRLELLVLSHVDADHIEGLIKLLGKKNLPLDIDDVWFNGYHHMPDPAADNDAEFLGAKQGEFLAALIRERGLPWNQAFDADTIFVPTAHHGTLPRKTLPGGMQLVLLSPTFKQLLKMSRRWDDELDKAGLLYATHEELMAALNKERKLAPDDDFLSDDSIDVDDLVGGRQGNDTSAANGSSIAFIGSFAGKRCLFGSDAHWNVLRDSVLQLAREEGVERVALDAFKVPHHGSRNNISDELLRVLDCRRFLVSTDGGRFKHPDREAIARIVGGAWRAGSIDAEPLSIEFNYRSRFTEPWGAQELRERWNYRANYPNERNAGLRVAL